MVVESGDSGVHTQKFLRAFPSFEPLLTPLLSPCEAMFLLDHIVAPGRGNHLLVVNMD